MTFSEHQFWRKQFSTSNLKHKEKYELHVAHLLCDPRSFVQNLEKSTCKQMLLCEHANICSIILASSSMSRWKTCNILCANDLRIKYGKHPYQALCCKRWHNRIYSILIVSARSFGQMKDRKNHCIWYLMLVMDHLCQIWRHKTITFTCHQWGSVAFNWDQFHSKCSRYYQSLKWVWKLCY